MIFRGKNSQGDKLARWDLSKLILKEDQDAADKRSAPIIFLMYSIWNCTSIRIGLYIFRVKFNKFTQNLNCNGLCLALKVPTTSYIFLQDLGLREKNPVLTLKKCVSVAYSIGKLSQTQNCRKIRLVDRHLSVSYTHLTLPTNREV